MPTQDYTISHTGSVLGDDSVDRMQNQTSPQRETPVLAFECPDNFDSVQFVGRRDPTRFIPRTMQSATLTDDDASGALEEGERTIALAGTIQPITGEKDVADQPYPVVEAVNVTQGTEIDPETEITVDYAANEVVIDEGAVAAGDDVKVYPILADGTLKLYTTNALGQTEGPVYPWDFPLRRFHDMKQDKRGTEINLHGSATVETFEEIEVHIDSPQALVWEDADYPGAYVSEFEQDVAITF